MTYFDQAHFYYPFFYDEDFVIESEWAIYIGYGIWVHEELYYPYLIFPRYVVPFQETFYPILIDLSRNSMWFQKIKSLIEFQLVWYDPFRTFWFNSFKNMEDCWMHLERAYVETNFYDNMCYLRDIIFVTEFVDYCGRKYGTFSAYTFFCSLIYIFGLLIIPGILNFFMTRYRSVQTFCGEVFTGKYYEYYDFMEFEGTSFIWELFYDPDTESDGEDTYYDYWSLLIFGCLYFATDPHDYGHWKLYHTVSLDGGNDFFDASFEYFH